VYTICYRILFYTSYKHIIVTLIGSIICFSILELYPIRDVKDGEVYINKHGFYAFTVIYFISIVNIYIFTKFKVFDFIKNSNGVIILVAYIFIDSILFISYIWKIRLKSFHYFYSINIFILIILLALSYYTPIYFIYGKNILRINSIFHGNILAFIINSSIVFIHPAFVEEYVYRGLLISGLLGIGVNKVNSNIIQAVLFGLLHFNYYVDLGFLCFVPTVGQMIIGFLLGKLYLKTKSLTPCIILHALIDIV
jgi:membrane protease YdiL (CAAX protease family)